MAVEQRADGVQHLQRVSHVAAAAAVDDDGPCGEEEPAELLVHFRRVLFARLRIQQVGVERGCALVFAGIGVDRAPVRLPVLLQYAAAQGGLSPLEPREGGSTPLARRGQPRQGVRRAEQHCCRLPQPLPRRRRRQQADKYCVGLCVPLPQQLRPRRLQAEKQCGEFCVLGSLHGW